MHELYEKIHATHDRAARRELRREYQLKLQHLHDDQIHHKHLSEEEIAKVKALREELIAETDPVEVKARCVALRAGREVFVGVGGWSGGWVVAGCGLVGWLVGWLVPCPALPGQS